MKSMNKADDFLRVKKAADFLGVTPNTLKNWEKEKKIIVYRHPLNKYRLYNKTDLQRLMDNIKPL